MRLTIFTTRLLLQELNSLAGDQFTWYARTKMLTDLIVDSRGEREKIT
jgi:hypothetical protein